MKWECYKKLKPIQKEEYMFEVERYRVQPTSYMMMMGVAGLMMLLVLLYVFIGYTVMVSPAMTEYIGQVSVIFSNAMAIILLCCIVVLILAVKLVFMEAIFIIRKYKFLRNHKQDIKKNMLSW